MKLQATTLVRTAVPSLQRIATVEDPFASEKDHKASPTRAGKETRSQLVTSFGDTPCCDNRGEQTHGFVTNEGPGGDPLEKKLPRASLGTSPNDKDLVGHA